MWERVWGEMGLLREGVEERRGEKGRGEGRRAWETREEGVGEERAISQILRR